MSTHIEKHKTGLAGEYLVAGMISLHGYLVSQTQKNYPSVDIFILDPKTETFKGIQVKTTVGNSIPLPVRHDNINEIESKIQCLFVFVKLGKDKKIEYYIVPRKDLIKIIKETDDAYFKGTSLKKVRMKAIAENYPIAISFSDISEYKDKWDLILD